MNRVLRVTLVAVFITFLLGLIFLSCDEDFYLGRTKEELYKEMFEVDSLMKTIQLQIDSTSIDFKRLYINAQRINSGHD